VARSAEVLVLITFIVETPEWSGRTNRPVAAALRAATWRDV